MGVHDGHRERMKQRFAEHGLENFADVNVLELLLFYVRPRCDTNAEAHALLEYFGTLDRVFEAPVTELEKVPGIGRETAVFLKLIPQVSRRYACRSAEREDILDSTSAAGSYVLPLFMYERDEVVYMLCLDSRCRVTCCRELTRGVVNAAEISVRKIVELAISQNAVGVILAHNHTSGSALPSREDDQTTRRVYSALGAVGIKLIDHIVVAGDDFISFADSGILGAV